jgi:N-acetyl sugar amidotransferase
MSSPKIAATLEVEEPRNANQPGHRVCTKCIMDTTDPDIAFDEDGVCSHCHRYEQVARARLFEGPENKHKLDELVAEISSRGRRKEYDCVIGVSGGVDSTYVAYLVKQFGLRPLAVHLDNGWDSELAVGNIENVLKKLNIDLYTYVIDWEEFKDLQLSFLRASTPDGEVPTDHAILATLYRVASQHEVRCIILGTNVISEAVLPLKWGYGYFDLRYIKAVHKQFGTKRLNSFPSFSLVKLFYYMILRRTRLISILNYIQYDKKKAIETIQRELGWIDYGGKHYESIYTRFFQAYILPRKFNIDKRKAHYSNLVLSGQMKREEALNKIREPISALVDLRQDREYTTKKLGISEEVFNQIMTLPPKTFLDYPSHYVLMEKMKKLRDTLKALKRSFFRN